MKKVFVISLVFILLAATAVPAFAGNGKPNDQANGVGNGAGNSTGLAPRDGNGNANGHTNENRALEKNTEKNKFSDDGNLKFKNQENTKWMFTPFYLQGTITSFDAGSMTLIVNVYHANAKVKEFMGTDLSITATTGTQIFQITQGDDDDGEAEGTTTVPTLSDASPKEYSYGDGDRIPITFDQLQSGQKVAIHGSLTDTTFTARLITLYLNQPAGDNP